jgi:protein SCO1/2
MTAPRKSNALLITLLLLFVVVIGGMVVYFGIMKNMPVRIKDVKIAGLFLPKPIEVSKFQLAINDGKSFTNDNLKGRWTMMFFGFTNCGMVCPTTMGALGKMYKTLQQQLPDNQMPQVIMVSVDPERDTIERMTAYATLFNKNFIGARAELPEVVALEKELHLVAVKMQAGDGKNQYTINHSAEVIVFNPDGKLQAFMSFPHVADQMVMDYKNMLRTQFA